MAMLRDSRVEIVRYGYSQQHDNSVMCWNCYLQNGDKIVMRSTDSVGATIRFRRTFSEKTSLYMLVHPMLKQSQTTSYICFLRLERTLFSCQKHFFREYSNKIKTHTQQHTSFKSSMKIRAFESSYKKPIYSYLLTGKINCAFMCKNRKCWVF